MQRDKPDVLGATRCAQCGKLRFVNKAEAKHHARKHRRSRVYRSCGGFWHIASWRPASVEAWYRERGA